MPLAVFVLGVAEGPPFGKANSTSSRHRHSFKSSFGKREKVLRRHLYFVQPFCVAIGQLWQGKIEVSRRKDRKKETI
jgi:hypothetical protein